MEKINEILAASISFITQISQKDFSNNQPDSTQAKDLYRKSTDADRGRTDH
jgi:hypothetical protein